MAKELEHLDARAGAALVVGEAAEELVEEAGVGEREDDQRRERERDEGEEDRARVELGSGEERN